MTKHKKVFFSLLHPPAFSISLRMLLERVTCVRLFNANCKSEVRNEKPLKFCLSTKILSFSFAIQRQEKWEIRMDGIKWIYLQVWYKERLSLEKGLKIHISGTFFQNKMKLDSSNRPSPQTLLCKNIFHNFRPFICNHHTIYNIPSEVWR